MMTENLPENTTFARSQRLYFLDWVRIIAFFILIFYHVGMYYVEWGWHIKSPHVSSTIQPLMMLSSPWRLSLLFLISGVASAFLLDKLQGYRFLRSRSLRLLLPLIFGMLLVVPPQPFFEVVEKLSYQGSYLDFMHLYLHAYRGFIIDGKVLDLPTWNHLWFVVYLWTYSVLFCVWMLVQPSWFHAARRWLQVNMKGRRILVLPIAYLVIARICLLSDFPPNHALLGDWYNHVTYLFLFFFGALMAVDAEFWNEVMALRWQALGIALPAWLFLIVYFSLDMDVTPKWLLILQRGVWASMSWAAIVAACGFARAHLNVDSAARRYLTQAVFPVYILHQTYIIVMAHYLKPLALPALGEGILLVVLTTASCFLSFEVIRRIFFLRPLFGLDAVYSYKSRSLSPG